MRLYVSENKKKYTASAEFAALCLAEYSGRGSSGFEIYKDESGKPQCRSADGAEYYFSISHSGNVIMCAVSEYNIGVDCQYMNINYDSCVKIASRFFHAGEIEALESCSSPDMYTNMFFEIWARKEAYAKFTGRGLAEGLTKFNSMDENHARNFLVIPYKEGMKTAAYCEKFFDNPLNDIVIF